MKATDEVGMIDMSKLIRDNCSPMELYKQIFNEEGGSSDTMLVAAGVWCLGSVCT
jgi:hypothetical protein